MQVTPLRKDVVCGCLLAQQARAASAAHAICGCAHLARGQHQRIRGTAVLCGAGGVGHDCLDVSRPKTPGLPQAARVVTGLCAVVRQNSVRQRFQQDTGLPSTGEMR
jgi:hypothetical protein